VNELQCATEEVAIYGRLVQQARTPVTPEARDILVFPGLVVGMGMIDKELGEAPVSQGRGQAVVAEELDKGSLVGLEAEVPRTLVDDVVLIVRLEVP